MTDLITRMRGIEEITKIILEELEKQGYYKGTFELGTVYAIKDIVLENGLLYMSMVDNNGTVPPSDLWQVLPRIADEKAEKNGSATEKFKVAQATEPEHAIPKGQLENYAAKKNGDSSQKFEIARATTGTEATRKDQADEDYAKKQGDSQQGFNVAEAEEDTQAVQKSQLDKAKRRRKKTETIQINGFIAGNLRYANGRLTKSLYSWAPKWAEAAKRGVVMPGLKEYYVSTAGDNTTGDSWTTALNSIADAMAKTDADIVFVDGTKVYDIYNQIATHTGVRDIAVVSVGGKAISAPIRKTTWSAGTEPLTWISTSTGGTPVGVVDLSVENVNGEFQKYRKVLTQQEVSAEPGTYTIDGSGSTSKIIVRRLDDNEPTNDTTAIMRSAVQRLSHKTSNVYIYGIRFMFSSAGALSVRESDRLSTVTVENCEFDHSYNGDGYQVKDIGLSVAINCIARRNANDGFNYHELNGISPHFIENGCIGMLSEEGQTGNGSSCHDDCRGVRLNGTYVENKGPGIADVGTSQTHNVNIQAAENYGSENAYGIQAAGNAIIWIDNAIAEGNDGEQIGAKENATLKTRSSYPDAKAIDSATIEEF